MIVPRSQQEHIEKLASTAALEIVVGDPMSDRSTHGPVANRLQFDRVQHMISVGIAEGAKLVAGGTGRPDRLKVGYYVRPTIFSEVHPEMEIAQQEIFGPVLSIIPYDTIDEAIEIANNTVYGLGAHVQGSNPDTVRTVAAQIRSGQVHLNYPAWDPNAPFGGYKQSGNGREYGIEGMEDYLEIKSILGFYP
jgi:acyl-CoA reductase-like NAD-dependent aldehyde dehydrogenase